jgi:hypothetical protein
MIPLHVKFVMVLEKFTMSKKCYITMKEPGDEPIQFGPVFMSKNDAEEWCHHKNTEDTSAGLWYLEECELR